MPQGIKILMIDDDKMLLDMYKERLELAGYKVEVSHNGEEGLAKVHQIKPDIVLLDIMMPKVNGYEALSSIKSDPTTKDIPVIMLSALMRDINKTKAVEAGADDYIIKSEAMPVDVIKKIEAVLKKYNKTLPTPPAEPPSTPLNEKPISEAVEDFKKTENTVIEIEPPVTSEPSAPTPAPETTSQPNAPVAARGPQRSPLALILIILIIILVVAGVFFYLKSVGAK